VTIGEKIIELRKKDKYTQEKLSELIGVSRQTLSNWESNVTSPDLSQAKKIVEIFKISLDDLINNETEIECSNNNSILSKLNGKKCFLDIDTYDYRLDFTTEVTIMDIDSSFIKISFVYKKKNIIKLLDMNLIHSISVIKESE